MDCIGSMAEVGTHVGGPPSHPSYYVIGVVRGLRVEEASSTPRDPARDTTRDCFTAETNPPMLSTNRRVRTNIRNPEIRHRVPGPVLRTWISTGRFSTEQTLQAHNFLNRLDPSIADRDETRTARRFERPSEPPALPTNTGQEIQPLARPYRLAP